MSSPELERFRTELAEVRREGAELLDDLTPEQLGWKPAPTAWSAGQVAEHLRTSSALYVPGMTRAIETARARGWAPDGYRPSLMGGWLIRSMSSPKRMPSPKVFRPTAGVHAEWAAEVAAYHAMTDRLGSLIDAAEGVSLTRARLSSPVTGLLRMNLGDAIALWLAHDRRHLGQIRRLREHAQFPKKTA
jgi:hypothetical protein